MEQVKDKIVQLVQPLQVNGITVGYQLTFCEGSGEADHDHIIRGVRLCGTNGNGTSTFSGEVKVDKTVELDPIELCARNG